MRREKLLFQAEKVDRPSAENISVLGSAGHPTPTPATLHCPEAARAADRPPDRSALTDGGSSNRQMGNGAEVVNSQPAQKLAKLLRHSEAVLWPWCILFCSFFPGFPS